MKRLFLFLLPVAVLLVGCTGTNQPSGLKVESKLITCPATGGDYTIDASSPNGEWTATASASWMRVMPASGEKGTTEVRVKIDTNKESAESKGFVTFVSGEEKVELPVSQVGSTKVGKKNVSELAHSLCIRSQCPYTNGTDTRSAPTKPKTNINRET